MGTKVFTMKEDKIIKASSPELVRAISRGNIVTIALDPRTHMVSPGFTSFELNKKGKIEEFSEGQNWRDQSPTIRTKKETLKIFKDVRKQGFFDGYTENKTHFTITHPRGEDR
jgi:hypothetical protein